MFTLCTNDSCNRAGWCKRFTYWRKVPEAELKHWGKKRFNCPDNRDIYPYYIRNKAREIYERDNPENAYTDDKSKQQEHQNNNRESRMREDNSPDSGTTESLQGWDSTITDSFLQLFGSLD